MAVVLTAVVVTNAGQDHAEISQVLQDFGYRTLLMLVSDDDIPGGIAGMPENVDLIIFDMEALDDPALRNDVRQSLSERGVPLIFSPGRRCYPAASQYIRVFYPELPSFIPAYARALAAHQAQ
jgi:hypothetical protein